MNNEFIIITGAVVFLLVAFAAIRLINRLPAGKLTKRILYGISIIIPVLGFGLAWYMKKYRNSNG